MDWRAAGLGLAFVAMWSSAFTSAHIVVAHVSPFLALSVRFLISGLLALGLGLAMGQKFRLSRAQWLAVILFGLCQNALYLGLNFKAMQTIEASVAAVIASLLPLIVAAFGWLFLREKLAPLGIAGLVAGFAGVLVIMSERIGHGSNLAGILLCFGGVMALSVATLLVKGIFSGGNLWIIVGAQMLVGSLALFPVSLMFETWHVDFTVPMVLSFAYMVLFPGIAATMIWFVLVRRIGPTRAAAFHFLNPFFGVATAAVILGERVTLRDLIGVAIIMAGILAVQISRASPAPARVSAILPD